MMQHPLVFIHGAGDSSRIWQLQIEQLDHVHPVYALDLPGHGERPDTLPAEVTPHDYAEAVNEIIQHELHLDSPIIVGHSLGGAIALTLALEHSSDLGGLILIGTGARIRVHPALLATARSNQQEARQQLVQASFTPNAAPTLLHSVVSEQVAPPFNVLYRDLIACNVFDCMTRLHEITLPTLIICGAEDTLTPVKYSQYLHDHITGSTLRILPHAGHYVMREQPEAVQLAIQEWLAQQHL